MAFLTVLKISVYHIDSFIPEIYLWFLSDRSESCRVQLSITDQFKRTLLGIVMTALQRALTHTGM